MAGTIKRDKYSGKELDVDDIKSEVVNTEEVNSIAEVTDGDDLQTKIDDEGADSYLRVHPGTYAADSFDVPYDNVTIELIEGATMKLADGAASNQTLYPTGNNFRLHGRGTIDPNPSQNTAPNHGIRAFPGAGRDGMEISGVTIKDPLSSGIVIVDYSDVKIEDVRIGDGSAELSGKFINVTAQNVNWETVIIRDNVVGPGDTDMSDGIVVESDVGSGATAERGVISGNIFKPPWCRLQSSSGNYYGIFAHNNFRSLSISDNILRADDSDGSGAGIAVRTPNLGDADATVSGNSLYGSGDSNHAIGIQINAANNAPHVCVTGNTVRNFDTANQYNLGTVNVAAGNGIVVTGNNADGSTSFDADTAVTANNN